MRWHGLRDCYRERVEAGSLRTAPDERTTSVCRLLPTAATGTSPRRAAFSRDRLPLRRHLWATHGRQTHLWPRDGEPAVLQVVLHRDSRGPCTRWLAWLDTAGTLSGTLSLIFICAVLAGLELSLSFDNAIVNANKPKEMTPKWQRRFLTWGILIAVFRIRVIFPLAIVAIAASVAPFAAMQRSASLTSNRASCSTRICRSQRPQPSASAFSP